MDFLLFSDQTTIISFNYVYQLIVVMEKGRVFFAVGTEFLNIILIKFMLPSVNKWRCTVKNLFQELYFQNSFQIIGWAFISWSQLP
jgi:hypothetical protein